MGINVIKNIPVNPYHFFRGYLCETRPEPPPLPPGGRNLEPRPLTPCFCSLNWALGPLGHAPRTMHHDTRTTNQAPTNAGGQAGTNKRGPLASRRAGRRAGGQAGRQIPQELRTFSRPGGSHPPGHGTKDHGPCYTLAGAFGGRLGACLTGYGFTLTTGQRKARPSLPRRAF